MCRESCVWKNEWSAQFCDAQFFFDSKDRLSVTICEWSLRLEGCMICGICAVKLAFERINDLCHLCREACIWRNEWPVASVPQTLRLEERSAQFSAALENASATLRFGSEKFCENCAAHLGLDEWLINAAETMDCAHQTLSEMFVVVHCAAMLCARKNAEWAQLFYARFFEKWVARPVPWNVRLRKKIRIACSMRFVPQKLMHIIKTARGKRSVLFINIA